MDITAISDLHGNFPDLQGGDLLIIAGDLTAMDTEIEYLRFFEYLITLKYTKIIFIAGNHDNWVEVNRKPYENGNIEYLEDSGTEFEGLKIWGSPWTKTFEGINPKYTAFTVDTDEELKKKWVLIPNDIDILITHSPPNGVLDAVVNPFYPIEFEHVGSTSLRNMVISNKFPNLKLHIFGHIHAYGGQQIKMGNTIFVNASHVDEVYDPVNPPIRVIL